MANDWGPSYKDLIDILAGLYTSPEEMQAAVEQAGLNPARFNFSGSRNPSGSMP